MALKVACLFALAVLASCRPNPPPSYAPPASYADTPPQYNYNYAVKDDYAGLDFGQDESRDGYNTQGSYYVLLPDGRIQRVSYTVNGDEGYVAQVTYEGEARPYQPPAPKAYQ